MKIRWLKKGNTETLEENAVESCVCASFTCTCDCNLWCTCDCARICVGNVY